MQKEKVCVAHMSLLPDPPRPEGSVAVVTAPGSRCGRPPAPLQARGKGRRVEVGNGNTSIQMGRQKNKSQ